MPAVNRSDQPYPLRTIDGEVTVVADEVYTEDLYATGLATFEDIYVLGTANLQGEAISLSDITADSLVVLQDTTLNTLTTTGTSNLADTNTQALSSTGLTVNGNITVPQVSNGIISAPFIASGNWTLGQALRVSSVNQAAVSYPNTGTGNNVQQTSPTLITPNIGAATGTSLSLSTPLSPASGGTGVTSLGLLNVGSALAIAGGNTGQVPVQLGSSSTGFIVPATTDRPLCSNGVGVLPTFKNLNLVTAVTGILGVANGGTGTATATGTGDNVKAVSPTIVTPTLLAPLCDTLTATDTINSGKTTNSTSASTGAITATNGGIGCAQDMWAGGRVIANSANDATNTTDGAIRSFGGASILKNIVAGGVIQSNIAQNATSAVTGGLRSIFGGLSCALDAFIGGRVLAKSTADATTASNGAIQTDGGISCAKSIFTSQNVKCNIVNCADIYATNCFGFPFDYEQGTFNPTLTAIEPADDAAFAGQISVNYIRRVGNYVKIGNFYMIHVDLEYKTTSSGLSLIGIALQNNIPGVASFAQGACAQYGLNVNMSPASILGAQDRFPATSTYNKTTNRWEQLVTLGTSDIPFGATRVPYLYNTDGTSPLFDTWRFNYVVTAHI